MKREMKIGDFVKVRHSGERFWCEIMGFDDAGIQARVNNYLISAPFDFGQTICIVTDDIIDHVPSNEGEK